MLPTNVMIFDQTYLYVTLLLDVVSWYKCWSGDQPIEKQRMLHCYLLDLCIVTK